MEKKKSLRYIAVPLVCLFLLLITSSCSKDSEKETKENKTGDTNAEYTESNEDLLTVDYKYFYDELSTGGEWVEINSNQLGLKSGDKKSSEILRENRNFIAQVFGINTAYAQTESDVFNLFVWRPTTELINKEMEASGEKPVLYTPYTNGQWTYTDAGWYFKGATPQEEITSHYGRWTQDPELGNVWLPGKTWSPAWVEWRQNSDYVAWAPVPPGTYIEKDVLPDKELSDDRYTVVEKKSFTEPSISKYRYQVVENKNKIMIKEMTKIDGVMIKEKTVINKGPEVSDIEKSSGKKIEQVKIVKTDKKDGVKPSDGVISVYTPELKKSTDKKNEPVSKPEKLVSYKDAKKITKEEKEELKAEDKEQKKEEKELKKEEKELKKEQKKEDKEVKKEQKKEEKEIKKEQKQESKEIKKEQKQGNKNEGKEKGKDKGNEKDDKKGKK